MPDARLSLKVITISPSHISVAVAEPVMAVSVEVAHSKKRSAAHTRFGVQSTLIQLVAIGAPYGGVPGPIYCQLNCTTFSLTGADIAGGGDTIVMTTPSSPVRNPPLLGSASRSHTTDGQKLLLSGPGSSTEKQI
jgi:hypothetical protein